MTWPFLPSEKQNFPRHVVLFSVFPDSWGFKGCIFLSILAWPGPECAFSQVLVWVQGIASSALIFLLLVTQHMILPLVLPTISLAQGSSPWLGLISCGFIETFWNAGNWVMSFGVSIKASGIWWRWEYILYHHWECGSSYGCPQLLGAIQSSYSRKMY